MTLPSGLEIPSEKIAEICRRYQIVEMAVFGSSARKDMRPDSDVDIMVVLDPDAKLGWSFFEIGDVLSAAIGRPVDFGTRDSLKPHAKLSALRDAVVIYNAER
ncbi:MAG: nucleotidyltransferase [Bryobacterales bacterium]|nr:nucleotidyltransferase [Bryobacterales bacterium]